MEIYRLEIRYVLIGVSHRVLQMAPWELSWFLKIYLSIPLKNKKKNHNILLIKFRDRRKKK